MLELSFKLEMILVSNEKWSLLVSNEKRFSLVPNSNRSSLVPNLKRSSLVSNLIRSSLVSNLKRSSLGSFKRDTVLWEQLFGWCHCAIRNLLLAKLDALIRFYDVRMHYLCKFFLLLVPNKFFYFCICPSFYFQSKIFSWRFIFAVILTCFHLL